MVYGVNLFAMPGMQCVAYPLEYKVFTATSQCLLFIAMIRIKLLRVLQLMLQVNKTVHAMPGIQHAVYTLATV